jgi:hypothetical protein
MNQALQEVLNGLDNYGFSANYGLAKTGFDRVMPANMPMPANMARPNPTNYSVNPVVSQTTVGTSSVQLSITVAKTLTGSGNSFNPVFLFGSDAITNSSRGYTVVKVNSPVQQTAFAFANNKNVVRFTYGDVTNFSTYTVSQSTDGEYPFFLNSLSGTKTMKVKGMQVSVANAADVAQLTNSIQTFEVDEFGKSMTNDLTVPIDLYQQQTNGRWYPAQFEISGRKGLQLNVNEVNALELNLFLYVDPKISGCNC